MDEGRGRPRVACLVVAAGRGTRARQADGVAKQYQHVGSLPVLTRTLRVFASHPRVDDMLVVFHPDDRLAYEAATEGLRARLMEPVPGGATRQDSVRAGLEALVAMAPDIVLVHDAARPFLSHDLVDRVLDALDAHAGAIPALPIADTLKRNAAGMLVGATVARNGLYRAQTPQGFRFAEILAAHRAAAAEGRSDFTDDAAVAEWRGMRVAIVEGAEINRKLTTVADIAQADREFRDGSWDGQERRSGIARGALPLTAGNRVRMLGASLPWRRSGGGCDGADRAAAALALALLRAARLPDADATLAEAGRRVREEGGGIASIDLAILADDLELAGQRDVMRAWVAECLAIEVTRVGLDARAPGELGLEASEEELRVVAHAIVTVPEAVAEGPRAASRRATFDAVDRPPVRPRHAGASLLDEVLSPADLRALPEEDLPRLAEEMRRAAAFGDLQVPELAIALHRVFDTPRDRLVVAAPDNALAQAALASPRADAGGDPFGGAQVVGSLSAALGMAVARDLRGGANRVVCVVGHDALSSGAAYEALNGAGARNERLVVVLADRDGAGATHVGAASAYLARLSSSSAYFRLRDAARQLARRLPRKWERRAARAEELTRTYWTGGTLFEELGFHYVGPIDGHDFAHLLPVLRNVRDADAGPILVHVVMRDAAAPPRAKVGDQPGRFAANLAEEGRLDPDIVGVAAGTGSGIDLQPFRDAFPARVFDLGVAAQHAVAFAAGLAAEGLRPFVAIDPAAMRRALGQVAEDVAPRRAAVRFALVAADASEGGAMVPLAGIPGLVAMVPADATELRHMVATQAAIDEGPSILCLPPAWGPGEAASQPMRGIRLQPGRGRVLRGGGLVALLSLGTPLRACMEASDMLAVAGIASTVADARFAMPLDEDLVRRLAREHDLLVTVEDERVGGFGASVLAVLARDGLLDGGSPRIRTLAVPCRLAGHDARAIADAVLSARRPGRRAQG